MILALRMHLNTALGCSLTNARRFLEQREILRASESPRILHAFFLSLFLSFSRELRNPLTRRV